MRKYKIKVELTEDEFNLLMHALWYETLFSYSEKTARAVIEKIKKSIEDEGKEDTKEG